MYNNALISRNLGALAQEAYLIPKFFINIFNSVFLNLNFLKEYSNERALLQTGSVQSRVEKLSHVNKKAIDQFIKFSEHKEKLLQRRDEAERANRSITEFIYT